MNMNMNFRYLLFGFNEYGRAGGFNDFIFEFSTFDEFKGKLENMKKTNPNIESRDVSDVELDIVEKSRGLTTGSLKSEKYTKVVKTIGKDVLQLHDIIYPATGEQTDKELDIFNNATSTSTVNTAKNENIISTPY